VSGIDLRKYHPGRVYDLPTSLADYLVVKGLARVEMRTVLDRRHDARADTPGRRFTDSLR
jgi:hypothetical protein